MPNNVHRAAERRLSALAKETGRSRADMLDVLMGIYKLNSIDVLIEGIKHQYNKGLTAAEIAQLQVLHAYLSEILKRLLIY